MIKSGVVTNTEGQRSDEASRSAPIFNILGSGGSGDSDASSIGRPLNHCHTQGSDLSSLFSDENQAIR